MVDDGQWLDAASAEVLSWVVRRLPERLPLRLLLARRASADPLPLDLERALDDALLTRLAPEPLDEDAVYALVRERLGMVLGPAELRRVHELSGGNPFFALELARAAGRDGLPGSLAGLVEGRLARLPAPTLAALGVCAHVARPTLELLAAATEADAWALLGPAVDDGVVDLAGGVVRFSHPLLAEGAGAAVAPSALRALHARLAEIAPTSEERATHRALVTEPPDARTAAALEEAAADALRRGATPLAAELSVQAVRFTPPHDDALVRRALAAGTALYAAGHTDRAFAVLEEASGLAPAGVGRARLRSELCLRHAGGGGAAALGGGDRGGGGRSDRPDPVLGDHRVRTDARRRLRRGPGVQPRGAALRAAGRSAHRGGRVHPRRPRRLRRLEERGQGSVRPGRSVRGRRAICCSTRTTLRTWPRG